MRNVLHVHIQGGYLYDTHTGYIPVRYIYRADTCTYLVTRDNYYTSHIFARLFVNIHVLPWIYTYLVHLMH